MKKNRPNGLKYVKHKENPTSFKKGMTPWNKGLKGVIKPNSGSFKKGERISPKTEFKPFNLIKRKGNQYQTRRAIEMFYCTKWTELNLQEDSVIHHIDGDIYNNSFENLCVMTRKDHSNFHRGVY